MTSPELAAIVKGIVVVVRRRVRETLDGVTTRLAVLEVHVTQVTDATKELSGIRERVAVLETRALVPGPPGPPGRDGSDGVGFEELAVVQRDDRSFTVTATHGDSVKEIGTARFALDIYRGIWADGRTYEPGDGVTWAGSEWHCHTTTATKPGDGSKAWTLKVKRGRDGKDGKDGPPGPPGERGRGGQQEYDDTRRR